MRLDPGVVRRLTRLGFPCALSLVCGTPAFADIVISSGATNDISCVSGVCTPTSSNAVLNVGDLEAMLGTGNVTLAASGEPVDVDIEASLSWVSTNKLTLDSYHSLNVSQPVAITGGGGLTVIINDGGTGGNFAFMPGANVAIWSLASSLTVNGTAYTLVANLSTLASDIATNPSGSYALAGNYDATPDGTYSSSPIATNFLGNFQGLGNTISNLNVVDKTIRANVGLFSFTEASATISNVVLKSASVVEKSDESNVGLLVGVNDGVLFGDHSSGVASSKGKQSGVGGLAGGNGGSVIASSSSADVTVSAESVGGGLVGGGGGVINDCFAVGSVKSVKVGSQVANNVGGLVGYAENAAINNSYAIGSVSGTGEPFVGGLVGEFQNDTVSSSYSTGAVKGAAQGEVGGFIGSYASGSATNSYWDTTTSGSNKAAGNSNTLAGVTGVTTKQLKSGLPAGFDPTVWAQSKSINKGFPYLIANPPQ